MPHKVTYSVTVEPEDIPVEGNASATGDLEYDHETELWIFDQLKRGNVAAWAVVTVTASVTINGETFSGYDSMGGCSYQSEASLVKSALEEYCMKDGALDDLRRTLSKAVERGEAAHKVLRGLKP